MESRSQTEFDGKVVLLTLRGQPMREGLYLENAEWKTIGGELCLVGNFPRPVSATDKPLLSMQVKWDAVSAWVVANSIEEFMACKRKGELKVFHPPSDME